MRLLLLLLLTGLVSQLRAEKGITLVYDANLPDKRSSAMWMAYAVMRAEYRTKNQVPLPNIGEVVPSYEEEVAGRSQTVQVYREIKQNEPGWTDPYWEALQKVEETGFMPEYVWTFHRQPNWPDSEMPKNLSSFKKWMEESLPSHKPDTRGGLYVKEVANQSPQPTRPTGG